MLAVRIGQLTAKVFHLLDLQPCRPLPWTLTTYSLPVSRRIPTVPVALTGGLVTYIENNADAITDYAARWDHGETISTAFAESTVDLVISRRFAKKQQMQWSKKGAHRLLQTRTRTLDGTLHDLFTTWYPAMPANEGQTLPLATAA
jgi:hypothetical protein